MSKIGKAKNYILNWIDDYREDKHFSKELANARLQERLASVASQSFLKLKCCFFSTHQTDVLSNLMCARWFLSTCQQRVKTQYKMKSLM